MGPDYWRDFVFYLRLVPVPDVCLRAARPWRESGEPTINIHLTDKEGGEGYQMIHGELVKVSFL